MSQTYLFTLYVQHITTYKYIIKYLLLLILKKVTKVTSKLHIFLLLLLPLCSLRRMLLPPEQAFSKVRSYFKKVTKVTHFCKPFSFTS